MKRLIEPVSRIYDVLVFTTQHDNVYSEEPIKNRIDIADRLWIGELPDDKGNTIIKACRPKGFNYKPTLQFGAFYCFVFELEDANPLRNWDEGNDLLKAVALSRIVRPTTISFEYASRLLEGASGKILGIQPRVIYGSGTMAYVAEPEKNYLTKENAEELKILFKTYNNKPKEIARALWFYEYASRNFELIIRWPLVCAGFEALINTDSSKSSRQFKVRVPILADCVGVKDVSRTKAEKMYDLRSKIFHGQTIRDAKNKDITLYKEMENILRLSIKEGIRNREFSDVISNRDLLDKMWKL